MKCERRDVAIAKMAGGDLSGWRAARLQRHLEGCARCRGLHQALVEQRMEWRAAHALKINGDVFAGLRATVMHGAEAQAQPIKNPLSATPFNTVILSDSEESRRPHTPDTFRVARHGRAKLPLSRHARLGILAAGAAALLIASALAVLGPYQFMPGTAARQDIAIRPDSNAMEMDEITPIDIIDDASFIAPDEEVAASDVVIRMATNNENVVILWLGNNSGG